MPFDAIGSVKSNINRISSESPSDYEQLRREQIEAKLYYLRDTNTQAEFDYVVEAELRQGEPREFGLPVKELCKRMKSRLKNVFRTKTNTPTIYEQLNMSSSEDSFQD